jgi:hypothetical protein
MLRIKLKKAIRFKRMAFHFALLLEDDSLQTKRKSYFKS